MVLTPDEYALIDRARLDEIAARLDLRAPNREAVEHIALALKQHYEVDESAAPLEAVVDAATGVGKTFILAAAIDYLAGEGVRNFAVVAPGRTILDKTVQNFTSGTRKSLLGGMDVQPIVVTAENFDSAAMAHAFEDPIKVKLFIFTVQSLLQPTTKQGRRTHEFREGLGEAFYQHLEGLEDLVIFADEHHCYFAPAFSNAIRALTPMGLIGLTATPAPPSEPDIIYRYPLSAAIADELVKAPVIVGRKDDRADPQTKLLDGIHLLEVKQQAMELYSKALEVEPVPPVMLVVAQTIEQANEYGDLIQSDQFLGGRYKDHVLVVHSDAPDTALAALDQVEEPESPVRIIISVGMLKEGWDVKNVYVICSMRASISDVLTEQTLGRGLRLPFGSYTGVEILDTLEVVAHEKYDELLQKKAVINEAFIDQRTRAVMKMTAQMKQAVTFETTTVEAPVGVSDSAAGQAGEATITTVEDRKKKVDDEAKKVVELKPRAGTPTIKVPRLVMQKVESTFSLADISDVKTFREKGERLAADPEEELRRTVVTAEIRTGADGIRQAFLKTATGVDHIEAAQLSLPLEGLRSQVLDVILLANATPARPKEINAAEPLIDAFFEGLGDKAQDVLSANFARVAGSLIELVTAEQRKFASKPTYDEVVDLVELPELRQGKAETSGDRKGKFKRGVGYTGWKKARYEQEWFDSSTERDMAHLLDDASQITAWVRLQRGDLPILFSDKNTYHPDFIAVEKGGTNWVIETKADKDMATEPVQDKKKAAERWASHVTADPMTGKTKWKYLLVSEGQLKQVKESWTALKKLAG
jgi:type III restriction enzyme